MSDKNKRYKITLTENQLALVGTAVEIMLRTGMGQTYDLAEWLTLAGHDMPSGTEFDIYIAERNVIESVLDGIMREVHPPIKTETKSDTVQELKTLYEAIGHQQWKDSGEDEWDVRSSKPIKFGNDPVPNIERIDE